MGCLGCSVSTQNGKPGGCGSSGGCSTGGCNRLNTYDWISAAEIEDIIPYDVVEVSFKNGARKSFFRNTEFSQVMTGDTVVVETGSGYDIGLVTLSGELVRLQMKKKKVSENSVTQNIIRRANERDMERLQEARELERSTMVQARAIARTLGLDMKIGDVEYQGDKRKATFYYTADGRVDFRELIRHYAKDFRVKIEMRQIGARQESARIGGLGSCGRELCCSTWLTDFKSVSTAAARYQNLAINQAKLSGQCGRLKCCLNYELDTYMDALEHFPKNAERLETEEGRAVLVKTDIFKKLMFYVYDGKNRNNTFYALAPEQVREIQQMNAQGKKPANFGEAATVVAADSEERDFEDVTGVIELPPDERRKKKKKKKKKGPPGQESRPDGSDQRRSRPPQDRPPREGGGGQGQPGQNRNKPPKTDKPPREGGGQGQPGQDRNNPPKGDRPPRDWKKTDRNKKR